MVDVRRVVRELRVFATVRQPSLVMIPQEKRDMRRNAPCHMRADRPECGVTLCERAIVQSA